MDHRPPAIFIGDAQGLDFLNSIATPSDAVIDWIDSATVVAAAGAAGIPTSATTPTRQTHSFRMPAWSAAPVTAAHHLDNLAGALRSRSSAGDKRTAKARRDG